MAALAYASFSKAEALYGEASELIHVGQYDEGIANLEEAVEIYPAYYAPWESLGVSHHMNGEHVKEVEAYERGVKANPENGNLYRELATAYHEMGEHEKELAAAKMAVKLPNSDDAFTNRVLDRAKREASGELKTEKHPGVKTTKDEEN